MSSSMVSVPTIERSEPSSTFLTIESTCSGLASRNRSAALRSDSTPPAGLNRAAPLTRHVAADRERGDALHLDLDALAGHGVAELHVDLPRRELQTANAVEQRHHQGA